MPAVAEEPMLEDFFVDQAGGVWMHMDTCLWELLGTDTFRAEAGVIALSDTGVRLSSSCCFVARVILAGAVFLLAHPVASGAVAGGG